MRRFFFLQNSPVDCFVKPKELTELGTGRSQFVRAGVQRVQPFVHGYRECNTPVQVKGGSLAQLSGVSPLSTGYYLTQKAARNQLRCPSPLSGKSKRKGGTHVKLTRHNGRAGKNGVYNPKHNDRSFDIANSEHIDEERAKQNLYWDCYNGFRNFKNPDKENELSATFEDVEQLFYRQRYRDFVTGQNERNVKNRHPERNKETGDLLKSKKTCPEETVYQIGTLDNHVPPELLIEIVTEFMEIVNERFGSHVHILNWALHLDESTPHIHERHVFDCENQYGEIAPQQEKALEALGFELPEPEKPVGRKNNRKMTFDSACRVLLFDVAKKHGLQLEEEPEYGGRAYLEKQDYIQGKYMLNIDSYTAAPVSLFSIVNKAHCQKKDLVNALMGQKNSNQKAFIWVRQNKGNDSRCIYFEGKNPSVLTGEILAITANAIFEMPRKDGIYTMASYLEKYQVLDELKKIDKFKSEGKI